MAALIAIAAGILIWRRILSSKGVPLRYYMVPIAFWTLAGSLDILITAVGAFGDPAREGNLGARVIFMIAGDWGPAVAAFLWISLWSMVALAIQRSAGGKAEALTLVMFYCLGSGHLLGFSTWFIPFCPYAAAVHSVFRYPIEPLYILVSGLALAALHLRVSRAIKTFGLDKGAG